MEVVAKSKFIRQTPRKLCLVAQQIRGLEALEAIEILKNLNKRAAKPILLTLKQGVGNAVNNFKLNKDNLRIKRVEIGKGSIYKRWRFASRGRVHQVQKKTSHIKIVLEGEREGEKEKEPEKRGKQLKAEK